MRSLHPIGFRRRFGEDWGVSALDLTWEWELCDGIEDDGNGDPAL